MIRKNTFGQQPRIHASAYVDPSSTVIGNVRIGRNVFVGPGAVLRADEPGSAIVIRNNVNIQDRVIVHALSDSRVVVNANTSLSHACIVHGPCVIGRGCFIGFNAVVFNATIQPGVFVGHLVVVENVRIPANRTIASHQAVTTAGRAAALPRISTRETAFKTKVIQTNAFLSHEYRRCTGGIRLSSMPPLARGYRPAGKVRQKIVQ
jgi:carbonic anhydrase/acetyltransferase-like protein (isoleucine patch superfamily)